MQATVRVGRPEFDAPNRVRFPLSASGDVRKFIRDDFRCEYGVPVDRLPSRILNIPVLANVLPVAWMMDARLRVDVVDEEFHQALPEVKAALQAMYPAIEFGGVLEAGSVMATETHFAPDRRIALFSGGVDSTATALAHRDHDLTLAMIWGVDIEFHQADAWKAMRSHAECFAHSLGVRTAFVKSNLRRFVSEPLMNDRLGTHLGHWWRAVCGFALLGSMAPLSHAIGAGTVCIPSTHSPGADFAWGTDPSIDDRVRWSGARCVHDLYVPRMEKIRRIAVHAPPVEVVVCPSGLGFGGRNCGRCEKCSRTIVNLLLAGADPRRHGIPSDEQSLIRIRDAIQTGRFRFDANRVFFWREIQRGIGTGIPAADPSVRDFFEWLRAFDFDEACRRSDAKDSLFRRAVRSAGRIIPSRLRSSARWAYYSFFDDI